MSTLTISKKRILEILAEFPDVFNVEDFIERIIIESKIEAARAEVNNGEYLTEEQLDEEIKKWH